MVVDRVHPQGPQAVVVLRAGRPDDPGPRVPGQLGQGGADSAIGPVGLHGLISLELGQHLPATGVDPALLYDAEVRSLVRRARLS